MNHIKEIVEFACVSNYSQDNVLFYFYENYPSIVEYRFRNKNTNEDNYHTYRISFVVIYKNDNQYILIYGQVGQCMCEENGLCKCCEKSTFRRIEKVDFFSTLYECVMKYYTYCKNFHNTCAINDKYFELEDDEIIQLDEKYQRKIDNALYAFDLKDNVYIATNDFVNEYFNVVSNIFREEVREIRK